MRTIELSRVDEIVMRAASSAFRNKRVHRVFSEPSTDSDGEEALSVTVVLDDNVDGTKSGDAALKTILGIQQQLQAAGEDRLAIVSFAKEHELEDDADA